MISEHCKSMETYVLVSCKIKTYLLKGNHKSIMEIANELVIVHAYATHCMVTLCQTYSSTEI